MTREKDVSARRSNVKRLRRKLNRMLSMPSKELKILFWPRRRLKYIGLRNKPAKKNWMLKSKAK
jgi:hypothetical protein